MRPIEPYIFVRGGKEKKNWSSSGKTGIIKRSHAADESARLLAHAVTNGIRCIAFCKTRMLGE